MMIESLARRSALAAFAACSLGIFGAVPAAQAANVTLTGWAYGSGNVVASTAYTGWAGGFGGSLAGSGIADGSPFLTYCIELEEHFGFSNSAMTGYAVVDGASYFQRRRGDAAIAQRLGQLFSYVAANPTSVDTAAESSSMQLAVWNIVYDSDFSVIAPGRFSALSASDPLSQGAERLLTGAAGVGRSSFDVYALEKSGSQDFVVLNARVQRQEATVPEPGSLALAASALVAGWAVRRRS